MPAKKPAAARASHGRVVEYVSAGTADGLGPAGTLHSATISEVLGDVRPDATVHLLVNTRRGVYPVESVPHSAENVPNSWHWLTFVPPVEHKDD